ncbi:MAG: hypothetical protein ACI97A_003981 [Planctomycetota bacterium]|jgi:hypothetical protein
MILSMVFLLEWRLYTKTILELPSNVEKKEEQKIRESPQIEVKPG